MCKSQSSLILSSAGSKLAVKVFNKWLGEKIFKEQLCGVWFGGVCRTKKNLSDFGTTCESVIFEGQESVHGWVWWVSRPK